MDHLFRINDLAGILAVFAAFSEILIQDQWVSGEYPGDLSREAALSGLCETPSSVSSQAGKCRPVIVSNLLTQ